jgi:hypothetical protein
MGSAFTYQGRLEGLGGLVDGKCDFQFSLFASPEGSDQVDTTLERSEVQMDDGYFTIPDLDFGAEAFHGEARWLAIAVRCPTGYGNYALLNPRQRLTGAPAALSLALPFTAEANIAGPLAWFENDGAGEAAGFSSAQGIALYVDSARLNGLHIASAGQDGVRVVSAGGRGLAVDTADSDGVFINSANGNGVKVSSADYNGVQVDSADANGILVSSAGLDGLHIGSVVDDGIQILKANDTGMYIGEASTGMSVESAASYGLLVSSAGWDGVYVSSAGRDGIYVSSAVSDGVDVAGSAYAGNFRGDINVTGDCFGCTLAVFGLNASAQALEPGQVVAIQGIQAETFNNTPGVWLVVPATESMTAVGVVRGRAELDKSPASADKQEGETSQRLVPGEGAAQPGEYLSIVIYGPMQVKANLADGAIQPGMRLVVSASGTVRALKMVEVEGIVVAESAPQLGIALSELDEQGMVWVLVNPQ